MRIIVCVKQVPDTNEVKIDPETGTMIRAGVPSILNPDDKNALEQALLLKDEAGAHVTVLTMGPPQAAETLKECLAMGADDAVLLSDRAFAGSDTWATSNALAAAVRKLGGFDLILTGRQAIDGDTAQVGPQLAERLDIAQITYAQSLEIDADTVRCQRLLEDGYEIVETKTPALITAIKELNRPRYMSIRGIYDAFGENANIKVWGVADLGIDASQVGLKASPTSVNRSFSPPPKPKGKKMLDGTVDEMAGALAAELKRLHVI
ncbi:MAG: electron transfer flavoprotein subunit beta/FixA family protein [Oscillospiraceae bacterium]|jgi:electron transfer flavoprotein beta subunit|nr:electron transfer flavoprotein subunit beta/FixA family protein [Oscillospiraceae bacterium]